jgi:hypothetical protein
LRASSVNSQRLISSLSEASYKHEVSNVDANQFGYRFVSPVNTRRYIATMPAHDSVGTSRHVPNMPAPDSVTKTLDYRKEYDEYDEIMRCPIRHTLGATETTNFPSMVPPGAVFDVLEEAQREWESAVKDGIHASFDQDQSDNPYDEEMGENCDIEFGVDVDKSLY